MARQIGHGVAGGWGGESIPFPGIFLWTAEWAGEGQQWKSPGFASRKFQGQRFKVH